MLTATSATFRVLCIPSLLLLSACGGGTTTQPSPAPAPSSSEQAAHLQTFTTTLSGISITMVGADPTQPGAGTSMIPVVILPIRLSFPASATTLSPEDAACGDTVPALTRFVDSPIFQAVDWNDATGFAGNTQFADAFQRANLFKYTSAISPDYHVLLAPITVLPAVPYTAPAGATVEPNTACPGRFMGGVPISFMDSIYHEQVAMHHITADALLILLTYDVKFLLPTHGFYLGYHNSDGLQTYIVVSYADAGFSAAPGFSTSDIAVPSHEVAEWLDNPFLSNVISPDWADPNAPQDCDDRIEVGDPLDGYNYPVPTPGYTYHVQELVYFSWFARDNPSIAYDGRYSTRGTFAVPAKSCE